MDEQGIQTHAENTIHVDEKVCANAQMGAACSVRGRSGKDEKVRAFSSNHGSVAQLVSAAAS